MGKIEVFIQNKGKIIPLEVPKDSNISYLKELISSKIEVNKEQIKLIYKGILKDEDLIEQTQIKEGAKVAMIITNVQAIQELKQSEIKLHNRPKIPTARPNKTRNIEEIQLQKYTFLRLETLEEFPNRDKAYEILNKLKEDLGVVAIMRKYHWQVGSLIELSPLQRDILGYNRNKGQTIALRLRTDDLSGFIIYSQIRKVLMHELAHMIHSEHDKHFHELNRKLNKEVIELDWTQSKGSRVSSRTEQYDPSRTYYSSHNNEQLGHKLGGRRLNIQEFNTSAQFRREIIADAIDLRLSKEEEELVEACGCSPKIKP